MSTFRIGAHTYLFTQYGFDQSARLDEIFDTVAQSGYQAIEMCTPMLGSPDWKARVDAAVQRTGLGIVGASHGQPMWDPAKHDAILAEMDAYSDKLSQLGRVQCGVSCGGKKYAERTEAENAQAVRVWRELAEMFRLKGVVLNYHTHGEPIGDIRHVIDNVPADLLPLGPDLDWLRVGGVDPEAFVRENAARLSMLHIRDYHLGGDRTEALGEGDADYARLKRILDDIGFSGEFVVELAIPPKTQPTRSPLELLRKSREHLRQTMGI